MSLTSLENPKKEPVSLAEVKAYVRIDYDQDDLILENLIKAARQVVEIYTTRSLIFQTWRYTLKTQSGVSFSDPYYLAGQRSRGRRGIEIPRSPFIKLLYSPRLVQENKEIPIENYRLDTAGRVAHIHFENMLLEQYASHSMIQIDFQSGYGEEPHDIPEPLRQAILMTVADLYDHPPYSNDNGVGNILLNPAVTQLIRPFKVMRLI